MAGTAPTGNCATALTDDFLAVDHDGAGDRPALAQHLVDEHGQRGAEAGADDPAATAQDGGAADDDGGDDDQLGGKAGLRGDALVLGDRHQSGERGAERRQKIGADAHPARRDAGIDRRLLVAAGREGLITPARLGQRDRAKRDDDQGDRDLVVEAEGVGLAQVEECRKIAGLDGIADRLSAGEAEHDAAPDQQHGQGRDEGGNSQDR